MNKTALTFLQTLLSQPTPSGYEQPGQRMLAAYMESFADRVERDVHGNVWGVLNANAPRRVMLAGHCDEIGLMVMHIDDQGFIHFESVGGVNIPLLQGERITLHTRKGPVQGVIGVKPIHLMDAKEREGGVKKVSELWIDIGARKRKDAEKAVELGDIATINSGWTGLLNGLVACRGFDDRVGAFVVADVLRLLKGKRLNVAVHAVSTVQEEIGLRGAKTAAHGIDPHIGLAVDVGFATDAPNVEAKMVGEAKLGAGPILHRGPNFNPHLVKMLEGAAKAAAIKTQMQPIPKGSPTDANIMQLTRSGVATALVSIPCRYIHSPVETVALADVEKCVQLIASFIQRLSGKEDLMP